MVRGTVTVPGSSSWVAPLGAGGARSGAGAVVLAVSDRDPNHPVAAALDQRNAFHFDALAPGGYILFALDDKGGLDFASPEMLEQYAGQAERVNLNPGESKEVKLELITRGEL